jgi:hypothetical protein
MRKFLWLVSLIGSILGFLILVIGISVANGAPQEASSAAIAAVVTVAPYVLARAYSELRAPLPKKDDD